MGNFAAEIVVASEDIGAVSGVYHLESPSGPDAYEIAIVLSPFSQRTVAEVHYAILRGTDTRTGRILYIDEDLSSWPRPMSRAQRIALSVDERAAARARVARCRAARPAPEVLEIVPDPFGDVFGSAFAESMRETFERLRDRATSADPYRGGVRVDMRTGVIAVASDPFPSPPRPHVLVVDEDTETAQTLQGSKDFEVTHIDEGWAAIEAVEKRGFDAILCALRVGAMSGATLHRMIAKARPELAPRIAFIAAPHVVAGAPASSALGRVLVRPVTVEHVRALLA